MQNKFNIDKETLLKVYNDNKRSIRATSKALGVSKNVILNRMKKYDIEWDKRIFHTCNENFFDELNEAAMYWLGFLATDGCVTQRKSTYELTLNLSYKDIDHLKLFKNNIESSSSILEQISKKKPGGVYGFLKEKYKCCKIKISSKKLFDKLSDFNIVPRKTHIYTFPEKLKDHENVRHFIRGCIDGDGWWSKYTEKNNIRIEIGMCGNPIFVNETFNILKDKCNISFGSYYVRKSGKNANFKFSRKSEVKKIFEYLYKDATIYLPRKYEVASSLENI